MTGLAAAGELLCDRKQPVDWVIRDYTDIFALKQLFLMRTAILTSMRKTRENILTLGLKEYSEQKKLAPLISWS